MKLTVIGATGSFPGPGSPASCYLLTADGVAADGVTPKTWRILLDIGNGSLGVLQRYIRLEDLDAVLLSHLHPDHFMDLCGLHVKIHWDPAGWPAGRLPVYGPQGTAERIAVAYGMEPEPGMREDFDFHTWAERTQVQIGPFRVTPFAVRHPIEEAYALRVEADVVGDDGAVAPRVVTYSGDTDSCDGLVDAARGADMFLCEAAFHEGRDDAIEGVHLTGRRAGDMAARAGVGRLLLTHLPVWNDPQRSVAEAVEVYSGNLAVAVPGMSYRV